MTKAAAAPAKRPSRPKTTEEMVDGMRRQVKGLVARAPHEDPWLAAELCSLAAELEQAAVQAVAAARANGIPWHDIGLEFGFAHPRQGAFNKFARKIGEA